MCYADAADPEATERRTKERTMDTIVEMTTMSDQEKKRCQTETGILIKQNPLFEKEIFFEPHIQVCVYKTKYRKKLKFSKIFIHNIL